MLSKKYRLPVQSVLNQKGTTARGRYFFVKTFASQRPYPRAGVVVSSKVVPTAAGRNALKRVVYAEVRGLLPRLTPKEYLVIVQRGAYEASDKDVMISELKKLLTE